MSVWSKQEHNVDQGRGSPDTRVEVDTQGGGAAGSVSRTHAACVETTNGLMLSLSSDEGHNEREAVEDRVA